MSPGGLALIVGVVISISASNAVAQATKTSTRSRGAAAAAIEQIVITGTKKRRGQFEADAPVAVTAFGRQKLDAFQFRDVESLTFAIPNTQLDTVGTTKGVANFSIRGLGTNSSIPTVDPTVGLFMNGVYFGTNAGAVLDAFDLEAVEVLRGPQGILFGRNVTGGAVLLRTIRPGEFYSASAKVNVETGLETRLYGAVDLPVVPKVLKFRIAGQFRNDDGWFTNLEPVPGQDLGTTVNPVVEEKPFGFDKTWLIRPTATLTLGDAFTLHLTYEHGDTEAEGPPGQNSFRNPDPDLRGPYADPNAEDPRFRDQFAFSIDGTGFSNYTWDQVFGEIIIDLGDIGSITDIFGYRVLENQFLGDVDGLPRPWLHLIGGQFVNHMSNELRYQGNPLESLDLTVGFFSFYQRIEYRETRDVGLVRDDPGRTFGGNQDQYSLGGFSQLEYTVLDALTLIGGARVTWERKEVQAQFRSANGVQGACEPPPSFECPGEFPFDDDREWANVSGKLGIKWAFAEDNHVYGHWTQGFRSGGYNVRNTNPDPAAQQWFDEEAQNVIELGLKGSLFDRVRLNVAGFVNFMKDTQRETIADSATAGVVQVIANTADATIYGLEVDTTVLVLPNFVINGSLGLLNSEYTSVNSDLNLDGVVDDGDLDLTLPRLANLTTTLTAVYDIDIGDLGLVTLRGNWSYRGDSFFDDANRGVLPGGHVVDASIAYTFADVDLGTSLLHATLSLYGRNLTNRAFFGVNFPLPASLPNLATPDPDDTEAVGGVWSPLKEGRVIGAELRIDWEFR